MLMLPESLPYQQKNNCWCLLQDDDDDDDDISLFISVTPLLPLRS